MQSVFFTENPWLMNYCMDRSVSLISIQSNFQFSKDRTLWKNSLSHKMCKKFQNVSKTEENQKILIKFHEQSIFLKNPILE